MSSGECDTLTSHTTNSNSNFKIIQIMCILKNILNDHAGFKNSIPLNNNLFEIGLLNARDDFEPFIVYRFNLLGSNIDIEMYASVL